MKEFETIALERDSRGIVTLTLDRPAKHNAMNARMIAELTDAAHLLAADTDIRAVILAANGNTFCAGADLGWMEDQARKDREGKTRESRALAAMLAALDSLPKLLIGRIQGPAYGGGLGLIAICDIAIAVSDARFALTETRLGLIPATIGPFVVRRVGGGFARRIMLNAMPFGPEFALRCALVSRSCAPGDLDAAVEEEVQAALKCAPGAIAAAKALARELAGPDPASLSETTAGLLADRWESEEARAGIAAFFDRKSPPWV